MYDLNIMYILYSDECMSVVLQVAAMRRARAAKVAAARTASLEKEFESAFNGFASDGKPRARLNYTEKLLDTVGLNSKSQEALEDEIYKKRTKSFFQDAEDVVASAELHANNRRSAAFKAQLQDAADERSIIFNNLDEIQCF